MPAITALGLYGAATVGRALQWLGGRLSRRLKDIATVLKNRRDAFRLANLDDRMLADIGLTRSDLRDAYAEPPWHDPTAILTRRVTERRLAKLQAVSNCVSAMAFASPFGVSPPVSCYQPTSLPVGHRN
jgi:uncharacterized protein YjiS (DUF1127 family)